MLNVCLILHSRNRQDYRWISRSHFFYHWKNSTKNELTKKKLRNSSHSAFVETLEFLKSGDIIDYNTQRNHGECKKRKKQFKESWRTLKNSVINSRLTQQLIAEVGCTIQRCLISKEVWIDIKDINYRYNWKYSYEQDRYSTSEELEELYLVRRETVPGRTLGKC